MFEQMTLWGTANATSSPALEGGPTPCGSPDGLTTDQSGPARVLASRSAARDVAEGLPTNATSGQSSSASSASADLSKRLASRLEARLAGRGSPLYALTWKAWDMPLGPPICALRASGHRTSDSGSTGWPTPDASAFEARDLDRLRERRAKLAEKQGNNGFGLTLGQAVPLMLSGWPTATVADSRETANATATRSRGKASGTTLVDAARFAAGWATPTTRDWRDGRASEATMERNSRPLNEQAVGLLPASSSAPMGAPVRCQLNPRFSLWLMGYPESWVAAGASAEPAAASSKAAATPSSRSSRRSS